MTSTLDGSNGIDEKVKLFSDEDEKVKLIGEILSNESSREIFRLLGKEELTAHDMVEKTGLSLSLVLHHVQKMESVGIVKVNRITKNSKNQDMKHYLAIPALLILPSNVLRKAQTSKTFRNSFKRIMRIASIPIAALVSWIVTKSSITSYPSPTLSKYILPSANLQELFWPVTVTLVVIIIGLVIEIVNKNKKLASLYS